MPLSKEEYAKKKKKKKKRIHNGSSVQMENSGTRVTVRHHSVSLVIPNSYPRDGIFNQHLTTIKDSYIHTLAVVKVCRMDKQGSSVLKTYLSRSMTKPAH